MAAGAVEQHERRAGAAAVRGGERAEHPGQRSPCDAPGVTQPIEPYDHGMLDVGDGNLIYWETCGNPAGKAAVVLHGGPGSGCTPGWRR